MDIIKFTTNNCNYDTQEIARVQLLELYPEISETLAEDMSDVEEMKINESIEAMWVVLKDKNILENFSSDGFLK